MSGVCLQSQPRRAGHQELNRLMATPRQGLNGASLDQLLQGLRFRVTLPLAQPTTPAQRQSRARGAESRAGSGAESLLSLRHPTQTVAQIEVLAEGCREPIPGMYWLICQYLTSAASPFSTGFPIKAAHRES